MNSNDYWYNSDATLYYAYKKAYYNQIREQRDTINFSAWLSGLYNNKSFMDVLGPVLDKSYERSYPLNPIDFNELERQSLLTDAEREFEEMQEMIAFEEQMRIENSERIKRALGEKGE